MWSMFESAVSDHGSSSLLNPLPGCLTVRRHVREPTTESDYASVSGQAQIRPCTARPHHHAATAVRLSEVDASGDALSAPITVNNSGIDARNGQAYHGRKTIATNGTRPAALGSRSGEGQRAEERQRRQLVSRVRSCTGATGRARVRSRSPAGSKGWQWRVWRRRGSWPVPEYLVLSLPQQERLH